MSTNSTGCFLDRSHRTMQGQRAATWCLRPVTGTVSNICPGMRHPDMSGSGSTLTPQRHTGVEHGSDLMIEKCDLYIVGAGLAE